MNSTILHRCGLLRKQTLIVLALGCCFGQANAQDSVVWDTFSSDPNTEWGGVGVYMSSIFDDPFAQGASFLLDTGFVSGPDEGAIFFNSGIGAEQGASISYSDFQGGFDFFTTAFEIDFLMVDQEFDVQLTLSDSGGADGLGGVAIGDVVIPAGESHTASILFADLIISPGFSLSDVDQVSFQFNTPETPTASLDFVATEIRLLSVPEPSAFTLFSIGGFLMIRRRREF
jgi:hypothetical protein